MKKRKSKKSKKQHDSLVTDTDDSSKGKSNRSDSGGPPRPSDTLEGPEKGGPRKTPPKPFDEDPMPAATVSDQGGGHPEVPRKKKEKPAEAPAEPPQSRGKIREKKMNAKKARIEKDKGGLCRSDLDAKVNEVDPGLELLSSVPQEAVNPESNKEGTPFYTFFAEKKSFVQHVMRNTAPIRYMLLLTGRYPFHSTTNPDGTVTFYSKLYRPEGIYFIIVSVAAFYFLVMGSFNLVDVTLNLTFGNGRNRPKNCKYERMYETTLLDRNVVAFIDVWTALLHITLTSVNIYYKRHYIAKYLSYWTVAAQTLHVDVAHGLLKYSIIVVVFHIIVQIAVTILSIFRVSSRSVGTPNLFSILMFRLHFPCIFERNEATTRMTTAATSTSGSVTSSTPPQTSSNTTTSSISSTTPVRSSNSAASTTPVHEYLEFSPLQATLQMISGICLFYIYIASKVLILFFLHYCRMITKAFKSWNSRFHAVINFPDKFRQSVEGRTTYELLFKDHCTLLGLIESTDKCFSVVAESYVFLQMLNLILESYFVYRAAALGSELRWHPHTHPPNVTDNTTTGSTTPSTSTTTRRKYRWELLYSHPNDQDPFFKRKLDFIPGTILMLANLMILIIVLREAGKIGAVAKEGLEVIRRKTMMGRKTNQELWFTLSMSFSYTSQTQLSLQGSGFFQFDNVFVVTVVGIVFSNLVTVMQFSPPMDIDYTDGVYTDRRESPDTLRDRISGFLRDLEGQDKQWDKHEGHL